MNVSFFIKLLWHGWFGRSAALSGGRGSLKVPGSYPGSTDIGTEEKAELFMNQPGEEGTCGPAQVFTEGPSQQMWATGQSQVG